MELLQNPVSLHMRRWARAKYLRKTRWQLLACLIFASCRFQCVGCWFGNCCCCFRVWEGFEKYMRIVKGRWNKSKHPIKSINSSLKEGRSYLNRRWSFLFFAFRKTAYVQYLLVSFHPSSEVDTTDWKAVRHHSFYLVLDQVTQTLGVKWKRFVHLPLISTGQ